MSALDRAVLFTLRVADAFSLRRLARSEGQTLVEYALILAVIAILVIGALTFLQSQISSLFTTVGNDL